ncbi:MAG: transposase [Phycisphaerales bacterium]|nr:MAG: transposase [Phycisphaerales bacterium]
MRRLFKDIHLPRYVWQKEWVVHCKPAVQGTRAILNYLAPKSFPH